MRNIFQFKQFSVDQSGCAMKVNTDGVLLGALTEYVDPSTILDIGAGTGVIALMLAQRFGKARIDAVEIDKDAAATARRNFNHSPYKDRLVLHQSSFVDFFEGSADSKYDLIVTNPPFFLNSLKSETKARQTARHAGNTFFGDLFSLAARQLRPSGALMVILPLETVKSVQPMADAAGLHISRITNIRSYPNSAPHRQIIAYTMAKTEMRQDEFVIYASEKVYSQDYQLLLKDFFTIF